MGLGVQPIGDDPSHGAQTRPQSAIERVQAERRRLRAAQTREFLIPGFTILYGRYRRIGVDRAAEILNSGEPRVEVNAQLLVEACAGLIVREGDGVERFSDGYDEELAERLEIHVSSQADRDEARQVVLGVFEGDEQLMCSHAYDVHAWIEHRDEADTEALQGG